MSDPQPHSILIVEDERLVAKDIQDLSVCHGILTSLGGELRVESELGRGTRCVVLLPPAHQAQAPLRSVHLM